MPLGPEAFDRRRRRFMDGRGPGSAAIFSAAPEVMRSNDVEFLFRQHSDFQYLTGFPEPGAVCLLLPGHPTDEYVLFVRSRDPQRETWTGQRAGVQGAVECFGATVAHPIEELDQKLPEYIAERERLYYVLDPNLQAFSSRVVGWLERAQAERPRKGTGPTMLLDARDILHEMRLHKEPEEIDCMRRAAAISTDAHLAAMRAVRPGLHEYEIEGLIDYEFRRAGATGAAYPTIVASGTNATTLHYTRNDAVMREGDLVLIDAGAEVEFYCADVSRTFPVGPHFEGRGRTLYELVLAAQHAATKMIRPGVTLEEVHQCAVGVLVRGLLDLGLLAGSEDEIREKESYKPFFMHRTGHWLGMDAHDAGRYKTEGQSRALEEGMVLTVEPGLYLGEQIENLPAEWRGLGIRIEDDVLVTANGHEVLSDLVPREIDAVEAVRAEGP